MWISGVYYPIGSRFLQDLSVSTLIKNSSLFIHFLYFYVSMLTTKVYTQLLIKENWMNLNSTLSLQ